MNSLQLGGCRTSELNLRITSSSHSVCEHSVNAMDAEDEVSVYGN